MIRRCRCRGEVLRSALLDGGEPAYPLGTDFQARDVLSRLIFGARVSLLVGLMGTLVAGGLAPPWASCPAISVGG
jgi:ABC-type dipeptide/oligopeptide/nickel transport system permease subunit